MREIEVKFKGQVDHSNAELIKNAYDSLTACKKVLERVAATCCTPDRSPRMQAIISLLDDVISSVDSSNPPASSCLNDIAQCGSKIGYLYITCCIGKRGPRYERMLKHLNESYLILEPIINGSH